MKTCIAILVALVAVAQGFTPAPQQGARTSTELNSLFDRVSGMDLFKKENSFYGAREKKNVRSNNWKLIASPAVSPPCCRREILNLT
jgi:hypothetical protein